MYSSVCMQTVKLLSKLILDKKVYFKLCFETMTSAFHERKLESWVIHLASCLFSVTGRPHLKSFALNSVFSQGHISKWKLTGRPDVQDSISFIYILSPIKASGGPGKEYLTWKYIRTPAFAVSWAVRRASPRQDLNSYIQVQGR